MCGGMAVSICDLRFTIDDFEKRSLINLMKKLHLSLFLVLALTLFAAEPPPAVSLAKRELTKTLKARGEKSLPEVAARFVAAHGAELTRATLLALWADETHGAPLSRTGDTLWLLGQPQLLKDTAWLLHFGPLPAPRSLLHALPDN